MTLNGAYVFTATNLANTLRITHPLATYPAPDAKKEIWIFGDSVTYGWSVNDEETFPWLLQEKFPDYEVVNFGVQGYSTLNSLIQLREALQNGKKPKLVILSYASWVSRKTTISLTTLTRAPWRINSMPRNLNRFCAAYFRENSYGVVFLCDRMLQVSSAAVGSMATFPSSMC